MSAESIIEIAMLGLLGPALVWVSTKWGERLAHRVEELQGDLVAANQTAQEEITRRRRVDQELSERDPHYRALYDEAPHTYLSFSPDWLVLMSNRRAAELLRCHQDDLIGRSIFDLYVEGPTGRDRAKLLLSRFGTGGRIENEDIEMRRSDGEPVWVSWTLCETSEVISFRAAPLQSR